jgi:transposase-like protein
LWLDYASCLLESASVRKAASQLGVHRNTTFRWRHRFLSLAKTDRPHCLHGIAEADELYVPESEKGARHAAVAARPASAAFPMSRSASWWRVTARGKPWPLSPAKAH